MDTRDAFACLPPRRLARIWPALVLAAGTAQAQAAADAPARFGFVRQPRPD